QLEHLKTRADRLDTAERLEKRAQPIGRDAKDLDVHVRRLATHDAVANPPADEEGAAARVAHGHRDVARLRHGISRCLFRSAHPAPPVPPPYPPRPAYPARAYPARPA